MTVLKGSEGGEDIEVSDDPDGYNTLNVDLVPLFVTLSKVWVWLKYYAIMMHVELFICHAFYPY